MLTQVAKLEHALADRTNELGIVLATTAKPTEGLASGGGTLLSNLWHERALFKLPRILL
jgi:hypothetical protein